jgi:glycosyltransferase involved in cell wall biosynthesis
MSEQKCCQCPKVGKLRSLLVLQKVGLVPDNFGYNPLEGSRPEASFNLHEGSEELVSIIIVHKDRPEYLNICLQSIAVTSLNNNYEIIIVDNGSTVKDAIDFLDDLENQGECKIVRNKENLWWSKAANQGAKVANKNSKYLIFLHADVVIINPAWIDLLINVSESQDSGLVGVEMHSYRVDKTNIDYIEEWCMLVTKECYQDCGGFSEELPQIGSPFIFTIVAQRNNYRPQVIRNPIVHHYRIFGVDVSDFERFGEQAMITIPTILRNLQVNMIR